MPPAITPGITIDRYRIEAVVGAGSMGDVYRGVDIDLARKVAIKILSERHRSNQELRARFVREARAAAAVSHPNVVQVFAIGTFDNRPYIAMEFLDGTDLGTIVARQGPWSSLAAAQAVRDTARGLQAAARAGLIHRDVKPSNLVLLQEGLVKVTDFGLAKPLDPGNEPALTAMGVVVGTPDYIAPEQARGEAIDHRVDIYALGGTLYYLLAAVPPFRTGRPSEDKYLKVVARHLREPAPDARVRNPEADGELAELARAMMAKDASDRPPYELILAQLDRIVERLQRGGKQRLPTMPAPTDGSGGRVAPTPFVGGARPLAQAARHDMPGHADDEAEPTRVMPQHGLGAGAPAAQAAGAQAAGAQSGGARAAAQASAAGPAGAPMPRWLLGITVVSVLLFLTGLGLTLLSPAPAAPAPSGASPAAPVDDPGAVPAEEASEPAGRSAARPPLPVPPEGMLLVMQDDGTPWFFVDAAPVSHREYAAIFPKHKASRGAAGARPVTGVTFAYAQAYARSRGKRLLDAEEWEAAAHTQGFRDANGLWEWIAGETAKDSERLVIHGERGMATRSARNGDGTTFRLATDL